MNRPVRHPTRGPHRTVPSTPSLAVGGVRRTMATDVTRPDGFGREVVILLAGRDVRSGGDGLEVVDDVAATITADDLTGSVTRAPDRPQLVGLSLRRGWGRALAATVEPGQSVLRSLLEDLGGAFLVSGYAALRAGLLTASPEEGERRAAAQEDVCIGWAAGSEVVTMLRRTGANAVPMGPPVAPAAFPELDRTAPHTVRRVRRLDVVPTDGGAALSAHFRDSHCSADGDETVMHEYLVDAVVDAAGTLRDVAVEARVLPWSTCPGAVASAQSVVGTRLSDLADRVRADLRGPTTCTHLTSTLRSLADADELLTS